MNSIYKTRTKTIGPQSAKLLISLHERGQSVFTLSDVQEILGLNETSVRQFTHKLVQRGIATRLKPGLFILVPFELGDVSTFLGDPLMLVPDLFHDEDYYISHGSAMELHQMSTQPFLVVSVVSLLRKRNFSILGTEFRFIRNKPEHFFGIVEVWIPNRRKLFVSDRERTIIDGLRQPEYSGGIIEVSKALWNSRGKIDINKLVGYAMRVNICAVIRRLGFLIDLFDLDPSNNMDAIQGVLPPNTYSKLDPGLPPSGQHISNWGLQLNISPDELLLARTT